MLGIVLALVANALAVIVTARLLPNEPGALAYIDYRDWTAVGVFALIAGLLNAFLRPVVRFLTAPIGCITLGLFSVVINGLMFYLAARTNVGVEANFAGATVAALAAGLLSGALGFFVRDDNR